MFIRQKQNGRYYLCQSVRVHGKVRQKVLAYLGQQSTVEDAYANGTAKQRKKLAQFRDAQDVSNEQVEKLAEREYRRQMQKLPWTEIKVLLPHIDRM